MMNRLDILRDVSIDFFDQDVTINYPTIPFKMIVFIINDNTNMTKLVLVAFSFRLDFNSEAKDL